MIVAMKKVTVLTLDRYRNEALRTLRDLGVIHPEPVTRSLDETTDKTRREHEELAGIVNHLERRAEDRERSATKDTADRNNRTGEGDPDPAPQLLQMLAEHKNLTDHRVAVEREIRNTEPLGDFDPQAVEELGRKGVSLRLFRKSGKQPVSAPPGVVLHVLQRDRNQTIYVIIGPGDPDPGDQALSLPERSLHEMRNEHSEIRERLSELNQQLDAAIYYLPRLRRRLNQKAAALRFAETRAGMGRRETITYLRGYCPIDKLHSVEETARNQGWALLTEDPDPEDKVPTLLRHPAWIRPIRSVLGLMGILPGYREIDVSAAFLLFFSLFFAIIVGDAGYGVIFLGLTLLARRRWRHTAPPEPFRMMMVLSIATIIWGVLSGNVFGTSWFPTLFPWVTDRENMMLLCFLIGAIHLTVAHAWNAFTIINSPRALAQVGWIALTWTMFLTAYALILGAEFPAWGFVLLAGGLLLVILFMTPRRELKRDWISHAMLPLTLINNFVDVVSYVRLFAVGYATLAVAEAFNSMAIADEMTVLRGLVAALILFFGHSLNIILCALSVLVHGIRLNTLEFSGHIGMQWTGYVYHPFAAETPEKKR